MRIEAGRSAGGAGEGVSIGIADREQATPPKAPGLALPEQAAALGDRLRGERVAAVYTSRLARAQETWYRLSALEERFRGTARLAAERRRHLSADSDDARPGRDPAAMEGEAAEVRGQEESLREALDPKFRR